MACNSIKHQPCCCIEVGSPGVIVTCKCRSKQGSVVRVTKQDPHASHEKLHCFGLRRPAHELGEP